MTPEASDRDVEIVRAILVPGANGYPGTQSYRDALTALARLTERLEAAEREVLREADQSQLLIDAAEERAAELEKERDRLQHSIECADTPLMRDVLERVRELEDALRDIAHHDGRKVTLGVRELVGPEVDMRTIARAALSASNSGDEA